MQITVFYSPDPDKCMDLQVEATDTVKSVKQKIIAVYSPPDWANTALLAARGSTEYLENKKRLAQCRVQPGSVFKFSYARNLTTEEKLEMNTQGIQTEEFPVPPQMSISTLPPRPLPF
mmetsp:Transcript_163963/g.525865  ORF Transcript_163963/g.525865 Transcript_163963/m.525865 type:complete len:118 (+) Transcript_163963:72-425(+)